MIVISKPDHRLGKIERITGRPEACWAQQEISDRAQNTNEVSAENEQYVFRNGEFTDCPAV
jgi:hypothetical protein